MLDSKGRYSGKKTQWSLESRDGHVCILVDRASAEDNT